eukprot:SAG22_NODE_296_length_12811_cov_14.899780_8_plen_45_part_00
MPQVPVRKSRLTFQELDLAVYSDRTTLTYTEPEGEGSQELADSS